MVLLLPPELLVAHDVGEQVVELGLEVGEHFDVFPVLFGEPLDRPGVLGRIHGGVAAEQEVEEAHVHLLLVDQDGEVMWNENMSLCFSKSPRQP